jgi:hypothetical protein
VGGQILVVLKARDRVEDLIPYLEAIAKLGMKIVFLIPHPSDEWIWLLDHCLTGESARRTLTKGKSILEKYSWQIQDGFAQQRILPVREALEKKGIEVSVFICIRSLKGVLRDYIANADVHLIMQTARRNPVASIFRSIANFFRPVKRDTLPPVVLLHPGRKPRLEQRATFKKTRHAEPHVRRKPERDSESLAAGS